MRFLRALWVRGILMALVGVAATIFLTLDASPDDSWQMKAIGPALTVGGIVITALTFRSRS